MKQKKIRIDTQGPVTPLTTNPFSELGALLPQAAPADAAPTSPPEAASAHNPEPKFHIARTKKGHYPIFLEKRAAGKSVTIVRNVSGDTEALCTLLKKRCAAGGKALPDAVELQGNHLAKVEIILKGLGH